MSNERNEELSKQGRADGEECDANVQEGGGKRMMNCAKKNEERTCAGRTSMRFALSASNATPPQCARSFGATAATRRVNASSRSAALMPPSSPSSSSPKTPASIPLPRASSRSATGDGREDEKKRRRGGKRGGERDGVRGSQRKGAHAGARVAQRADRARDAPTGTSRRFDRFIASTM